MGKNGSNPLSMAWRDCHLNFKEKVCNCGENRNSTSQNSFNLHFIRIQILILIFNFRLATFTNFVLEFEVLIRSIFTFIYYEEKKQLGSPSNHSIMREIGQKYFSIIPSVTGKSVGEVKKKEKNPSFRIKVAPPADLLPIQKSRRSSCKRFFAAHEISLKFRMAPAPP